jgi:hypothetical protein
MADITRVYLATSTSSVAVVAPAANLRLLGFALIETASSPAAAKVSIQEGTGASLPTEIVGVNLAASESAREWYGDHGLPCPGGIYLNRISGETRAVIYYRTSDKAKQVYEAPSW